MQQVERRFERFADFVAQYSSRLSLGGMFLETEDVWAAGTAVAVSFHLSDDFRLFRGEGEVLWARPTAEHGPQGIGIRFRSLDDAGRNLVLKVLEEHVKSGGEPFDVEDLPKGARIATLGVEEKAPPAPVEEAAVGPDSEDFGAPWGETLPEMPDEILEVGDATGGDIPDPTFDGDVPPLGRVKHSESQVSEEAGSPAPELAPVAAGGEGDLAAEGAGAVFEVSEEAAHDWSDLEEGAVEPPVDDSDDAVIDWGKPEEEAQSRLDFAAEPETEPSGFGDDPFDAEVELEGEPVGEDESSIAPAESEGSGDDLDFGVAPADDGLFALDEDESEEDAIFAPGANLFGEPPADARPPGGDAPVFGGIIEPDAKPVSEEPGPGLPEPGFKDEIPSDEAFGADFGELPPLPAPSDAVDTRDSEPPPSGPVAAAGFDGPSNGPTTLEEAAPGLDLDASILSNVDAALGESPETTDVTDAVRVPVPTPGTSRLFDPGSQSPSADAGAPAPSGGFSFEEEAPDVFGVKGEGESSVPVGSRYDLPSAPISPAEAASTPAPFPTASEGEDTNYAHFAWSEERPTGFAGFLDSIQQRWKGLLGIGVVLCLAAGAWDQRDRLMALAGFEDPATSTASSSGELASVDAALSQAEAAATGGGEGAVVDVVAKAPEEASSDLGEPPVTRIPAPTETSPPATPRPQPTTPSAVSSTPPAAARVGARATLAASIGGTAEAGGTRVVIALNGSIDASRVQHFRLGSGAPRALVIVHGVEEPYYPATIPVGTLEVAQIRTGHHEKPEGPQLHIVLDLANSGVDFLDFTVRGSRIEMVLGGSG